MRTQADGAGEITGVTLRLGVTITGESGAAGGDDIALQTAQSHSGAPCTFLQLVGLGQPEDLPAAAEAVVEDAGRKPDRPGLDGDGQGRHGAAIFDQKDMKGQSCSGDCIYRFRYEDRVWAGGLCTALTC